MPPCPRGSCRTECFGTPGWRAPPAPVERCGHERLDVCAFGGGVEALEWGHDLAAREHLDPEPAVAHLLDDLRHPLGSCLHVEPLGPARGHPPLNFRLSDHLRSIDGGGRTCGG